ncbi:TetR/AcrR family transcriptional regulator [Gracilibacillus dipsosauri]|uniref:TetR/AcrR family transcriptional regulator n=1 Tax=Gracilibacillus dipsosauri TaxID=178340 RepID=UPI00240958D6
MRKTKEDTELTIQELLKIARSLFTEKGFANVALEEIVKEAGLTRGALYHHFKNKHGLFLAVFEAVQREVGEKVEEEAAKSSDMWEQLLLGCRAFITSSVKSQNQRILLIDGPAVLGWDTFRLMDEKYSMKSLKEQLLKMKDHQLLMPVSIDAMTHCLSGAMNEAILWIAENQEGVESRTEEVMENLFLMIKGFEKL